MREIKFRTWMGNTFHYWGFMKEEGSLYFNGIASSNESMSYKLEHSQQYTGLTDKKGKEIYEGDIIAHLKYGGNWCIVWVTDACGFSLRNKYGVSMHLSRLCKPNIEVIGNIYENPEFDGGLECIYCAV